MVLSCHCLGDWGEEGDHSKRSRLLRWQIENVSQKKVKRNVVSARIINSSNVWWDESSSSPSPPTCGCYLRDFYIRNVINNSLHHYICHDGNRLARLKSFQFRMFKLRTMKDCVLLEFWSDSRAKHRNLLRCKRQLIARYHQHLDLDLPTSLSTFLQ